MANHHLEPGGERLSQKRGPMVSMSPHCCFIHHFSTWSVFHHHYLRQMDENGANVLFLNRLVAHCKQAKMNKWCVFRFVWGFFLCIDGTWTDATQLVTKPMGFLGVVQANSVRSARQWGGFPPASGTAESPASNTSHRTRWTTPHFFYGFSVLEHTSWLKFSTCHVGLMSDPYMHLQYRCHADPGSTCQWNPISPIGLRELSSTCWWHYTGNPTRAVSVFY